MNNEIKDQCEQLNMMYEFAKNKPIANLTCGTVTMSFRELEPVYASDVDSNQAEEKEEGRDMDTEGKYDPDYLISNAPTNLF